MADDIDTDYDRGVRLVLGSMLWESIRFVGLHDHVVQSHSNLSLSHQDYEQHERPDVVKQAFFTPLLTTSNVLGLLITACAIYVAALLTNRLYLSPIAHVPGPFLAKVTHWYEFYHNFIRTGMYYEVIEEMHRKYGPVVRVTPEEVHVREPLAYHTVFVTGAVRKTNSYARFSNGTGFEDMTAISVQHDAHRKLRTPLDKLFARHSIRHMEPRIAASVDRLYARLQGFVGTGQIINLTNAFSSLTTDIISSVIFEEPSDYLGDPEFNETWYDTLKRGTKSVPLFKHLPGVIALFARPILRSFMSRVLKWTIWDEKARRQIMLARKRPSDIAKTRVETTVLDHLVHSELVEEQFGASGFARLAQLIQQAGAHNVSHTLGTIVTYLLREPELMVPLRQELAAVWEGRAEGKADPTWLELEKLPYLQSCIAEGLRMAIGGMNRTPRVFPDDDLDVSGCTIPRGTAVSMTTYWMHNDPTAFPDPEKFTPRRWLDASPEQLKFMQAHYVPFAKGSRTCVGQNLVYMQLYLTLSRLFQPGAPQLQLYDTGLRDIVAIHGLLFPMPPFDTVGVRATVS